jgi:methylmalonyl-CoA mutase N-terminal domain/subunit
VGSSLDPALERAQVETLRHVRASRSQPAVGVALAARNSNNLMPRIMDAADVYATVGEISDVLRGAFGEYCEA